MNDMETRLRIPKNWQDFEMLCHKLWRDIWGDPNTQRNGRQGQSQSGVDIFGKPAYRGFYAGVQCKDKDSKLGSELTSKELEAECKKATSFNPHIGEFSMATTTARDASLQEHARRLTDAQAFPFAVHVWSWDDIEEEIRCRPMLLRTYYPDVEYHSHGATRVNMSFVSHRDQCQAFFSRPEMQRRIPSGLREFLLPLCYELSDNAYRHGKASMFSIICDDISIRLEDNGSPFDPITDLDPMKVSAKSHVGSYVFDAFRREYEGIVNVSYHRISDQGNGLNSLTMVFSEPTSTLGSPSPEACIDISLAVGREAAERLAASVVVPRETSELVIVIGNSYNVSALVEFIRCMLNRIGLDMRLIVYLPRLGLLTPIEQWFDDKRLSIRFR
jgi:hypothetical protein